MNATIYKFSKDPRSTARPTGGTSITGITFKNDTSRENPILKITADALSNDYDWNYIHIMGNYYYINDIVFLNNDIWELHCTIDSLATWKTEIEASTQYIVRTTDANTRDGSIIDNAYPMTTSISTDHARDVGTTWIGSYQHAVIGVLGPNAGDTTTYYEMTTTALTALITALYGVDVTTALNISTIELGLLKTLFDPIKYMTSCVLLPISGSVSGDTTSINTGYVNLPIPSLDVKKIAPTNYRTFHGTITYGNHPQASARGKYLNGSPYTDRLLTIMPFGTFNIDGSKLNDYENKIRYEAHMCKADGNAILEVYTIPQDYVGTNFHNTLFWSNAMLGIQVPLYQSDSIFKQSYSLLGSQIGTVGAALSGNFGALPGLASDWCGTVNKSHAPDVHMVGGSSGSFITAANTQPTLDSTFYRVTLEDNQLGHMVCGNYVLGSLHGINYCQNAHIALPAPSEEIENIKNVMNTGIIIP